MRNDSYVIVTDATADLTLPLIQRFGLHVVPMPLVVGDQEYTHYADAREISLEEVYRRLRQGEAASTAQINMNTYLTCFEPLLQQGKDLIYLCFSSGLSGMIQNAHMAIEQLKNQYPNRTLYCVDSLCASVGQGLLACYAGKKQEEGMELERLYQWLETEKRHLCHWFTVDDLHFLHRGGRVSKAVAVAGSLLQIKPVLHVDDAGHLIMMEKARGRGKALELMEQHMQEDGIDLENQVIFIGHGEDEQSAQKLADLIIQKIKVKSIEIMPIGPVIGAHSGPGTIALFYMGRKR